MNAFLGRVYGVFAATVFLLIALAVFCPLVILGPTLAIRRFFGRVGVRVALFCIGVPFRVRGQANLPSTACVVVSNHASYADGILLTSALPARFTFVVQDGAANWPYVGLVIRRMGVTFINRTDVREGAAQTRALIKRVQGGESLGIFAEGTFKPDPGLIAFKKGAFLIAARAQVPVVPVAMRGTRTLYGGERRLPRWSAVEVDILPPVPSSADPLHLRDTARAAVLAASGEPDALASSETE